MMVKHVLAHLSSLILSMKVACLCHPVVILTPSLPQPVKFPGRKVHTYMPANSIFDGPITNLLSTLCSFIEIFSHAHAKGEKSLSGFRFGTFMECFQSDGVANVAVKGLILLMIIVVTSVAPISPTRVSTSHFTRLTIGARVHAQNLQ